MCANDPTIHEPISSDEFERRTVLKGALSAGATGTILGVFAGNASGQDLENELVVAARSEFVEYRFEVDGEVAKGNLTGPNDEIIEPGDDEYPTEDQDDDEDEEDDDEDEEVTIVDGQLNAENRDDYQFSGEITGFELPRGNAAITINGESVSLEELSGAKQVSIEAQGEVVDYEFVVSEEVRPGSRADVDRNDEIDDRTVTGRVAGRGVDNYLFLGDITEFRVSDRDLTIRVNGEEVAMD